jgi:hypothetical protein
MANWVRAELVFCLVLSFLQLGTSLRVAGAQDNAREVAQDNIQDNTQDNRLRAGDAVVEIAQAELAKSSDSERRVSSPDSVTDPCAILPEDPYPSLPSEEKLTVCDRAHQCANILSDLNGIAGAALFMCGGITENFDLMTLAASISSASFFNDLFRGCKQKFKLIQAEPKSLRARCTWVDMIGQVINFTGLALIGAGVKPEVGAWFLLVGSAVKSTSLAVLLKNYGVDGTFGNANTTTNSIFRVGLLSLGGLTGCGILATADTMDSRELLRLGAYVLGGVGVLGNAEVLVRDCQALGR